MTLCIIGCDYLNNKTLILEIAGIRFIIEHKRAHYININNKIYYQDNIFLTITDIGLRNYRMCLSRARYQLAFNSVRSWVMHEAEMNLYEQFKVYKLGCFSCIAQEPWGTWSMNLSSPLSCPLLKIEIRAVQCAVAVSCSSYSASGVLWCIQLYLISGSVHNV